MTWKARDAAAQLVARSLRFVIASVALIVALMIVACGGSDAGRAQAKTYAGLLIESIHETLGTPGKVGRLDHIGGPLWHVELVFSDGQRHCFTLDIDKFDFAATPTKGLYPVKCRAA